MSKLKKGDLVHVPSRVVGLGNEYVSAMVECTYLRQKGRKGLVDGIPYINGQKEVDLRLISRKLGFLVVQLGSFDIEGDFLEPLFQAIRITTEIILIPQYVWAVRVRSLNELSRFWAIKGALVSHVVLVGHGSTRGLAAGDDTIVADDLIEEIQKNPPKGQAPIIVSMCCKSGNGLFGKVMSASPYCRALIGPSGAIHAANAALFYQSFLSHSLLDGRTLEKAYQIARVFTPGVTEFNMWQKKNLVPKPSRKQVLGH